MKILTMILIGFVAWYVLQVIADWKSSARPVNPASSPSSPS